MAFLSIRSLETLGIAGFEGFPLLSDLVLEIC
jgi:hypothetical protein